MSLIRNSNRNFKYFWLVFVLTACAAYQAAGQVQSGRQALLINKPEEALAYFQQVAQSNPNYIFQSELYREGIWTYVGRSQYSLGRLPEARQSLEKALSVYPDDYLARIYLGLTLLRSGEDSRGLKELAAGMKGLYDWLEYMNRTMSYTAFWDPLREIRSEIEKDLNALSGKDVDRQQLITSAEWIGKRMEEEIDLVRRDEQRHRDQDFERFPGRGIGIGIGIGF
jgi:tetratricopeptide (TPR) repeat protein